MKMNYKQDYKMLKELSKYKVKCNCSHVVVVTRKDRIICNHCGNWIYRTPEIEFKYKLLEKIKKCKGEKNENKNN